LPFKVPSPKAVIPLVFSREEIAIATIFSGIDYLKNGKDLLKD